MNPIAARFAEYDGKAVSILSEAQQACRDQPDFLRDLVALVGDPQEHLSDGASWILKAELEAGRALPAQVTARLVERLATVTTWQTQLHLCQLVEHLTLEEGQAAIFTAWAGALSDHKRPFIRAWSLTARSVIAADHAIFLEEAGQAIEDASEDPAASVRARARILARPSRS